MYHGKELKVIDVDKLQCTIRCRVFHKYLTFDNKKYINIHGALSNNINIINSNVNLTLEEYHGSRYQNNVI